MFLQDAIAAIVAAVEVLVDQAKVASTKEALTQVEVTLDEDRFGHEARLADTSFGTVATATELSHHHALAQQIVADTLAGIADDVSAFATNVAKSAEVLLEVDSNAADDVQQRTAVLERFDYLAHHSQGDANNNHTRDGLAGRNG